MPREESSFIREYDLPDAALLNDSKAAAQMMAFIPERTFVVIGKGSDPELELHATEIRADNVPVLRRGTGGCAVVLTPEMLAVSFALRHSPQLKSSEYFQLFNAVIIRGLQKQGITGLEHAGISDIALNGKKIAGTAIYRNRDVVFYHAVVNINGGTELMERYLKHPPRTPTYRADRKHSDFVTSLKKSGYDLDIERLIADTRAEYLLTTKTRLHAFSNIV